MSDALLVYIAGPYTSDPVRNTHRTLIAAEAVAKSGHLPVFTHANGLLWSLQYPDNRSEVWWTAYSLNLLDRCDALVRLHGASVGADAEVRYAEAMGKRVFATLDDFLEWAFVDARVPK